MANELRHADVGTALSKSEWEATGGHIFNSQAAGDIMYASSTSQLTRLGIGSAGQILQVNSGATAPEWTSSPTIVTAILPDSADGATIGSATAEWSDLYMADGAVIYLGADQDVTITHVADDGILINSDNYITFRDSALKIYSSTDGQLDIDADSEVEITATTVDLNGNLDVSGTYTGGGLMTTGGNIVIPNAGNIGSASDTDSIAISSAGVVTMNQIPVFSAGINVSGGTIAGTLATAAQGSVTSLGTLTALTVDDVAVDGKVITMTGSASDTAVLTAGTNGTLSIVTTDAAAAAANIQITADGTVDIDSAGVLTLDSGAAINIEPASGSAILLDGTISVDAGVVTGATSITSSAYVVGSDTLAEYIADTVGAMTTSNTETGITVTYKDADNTIDFAVGTLNQDTTGTAAGLSATLIVGSGGTGATSLTQNGVLVGNGTSAIGAVDMSTKGHILIGDGSGNPQMLGVGTNDYVLTADSGETTGVKWAAVTGAVTALNNATANELVTVGSTTTELDAEANLTFASDVLTIASSSSNLPRIDITNTNADATSAEIRFNKDSASGADSDVMGKISWYGTDAGNNTHQELAYMDAIITDSAHGSEAASLRFYVAENDATNTLGLQLAGQADDNGEVDVTIGAGAASTTTIAGTLTMGSTAAMTNAGLVAVANQSSITGLGTITSGTWQSSTAVIASAYLDADTAHLSTTQTFTGAKTFTNTVTVGVDDDGKDVKFFGESAGAYMEWDESADQLRIMGASADATTSTGKLLLATSLTDINANDVLGKVEFQAPHEAGGTDAITVASAIEAVAQDTFSSSVNSTDLIFKTGHSEAATEKFRITSEGELGVGGTNYGTDGQVLTSTGAGTAPAWEAIPSSGGLENYDEWVLDADHAANEYITSDWVRYNPVTSGEYHSTEKVGSGMTESSGVFSFPSTGKWLVDFHVIFNNDSFYGRTYATIEVSRPGDASSFSGLGQQLGNKHASSNSMIYVAPIMLDITNTTNQTIKFKTNAFGTNTTTLAGASGNEWWTGATFAKIAST